MISLDIKGLDQALKLVEEWESRTDWVLNEYTRSVATETLERVRKGIPGGSDWKEYRKSLELRSVRGLGKHSYGWAIISTPMTRSVSAVDGDQQLIYIEPRGALKKVPESVEILSRWSPWTLDLLPFKPRRSDARFISRRARKAEVERTRQNLAQNRPVWSAELESAGVSSDSTLSQGLETVPDLAFEGGRLEFGLGDQKARPHWRPALRKAQTRLKNFFDRDGRFERALFDSQYTGWRKQPSSQEISRNELKSIADFQELVGLRQ